MGPYSTPQGTCKVGAPAKLIFRNPFFTSSELKDAQRRTMNLASPQGPRRARRAPPGPTAARPVSAVINFFAAGSKPCVICVFGGRAAERVRRCRTQFLCIGIAAKLLIYPVQKIMSAATFITIHAFILENVKNNQLESCS